VTQIALDRVGRTPHTPAGSRLLSARGNELSDSFQRMSRIDSDTPTSPVAESSRHFI
jgi:hypothetical protein